MAKEEAAETRKHIVIDLWVTPEEHEFLQNAAAMYDVPVDEIVRRCVAAKRDHLQYDPLKHLPQFLDGVEKLARKLLK